MNSISDKKVQTLKKWSDLKFGMFIHVGVYSSLAGKWKGEDVPGLCEWMVARRQIPLVEYKECAKKYNPYKWNPNEIVDLIKKAGMKYLVITAKHHDGFAIYDSKVSDYNVVNSEYGKDMLAPLVDACRENGIMVGFYYSQDIDWEDPNGGGENFWDYDLKSKEYGIYLQKKVKPQLKELLTQYGDIDILWFDTPITLEKSDSKDIYDYVHSLQPQCIVNSRLGNGFSDFDSLGDNQVPGGASENYAETAGTLNDSWGYKESDKNWKSPEDLIIQLCCLLSKGANYLLNIGPHGDGSVLPDTKERLHALGQWVEKYKKAVYGTKPSPFAVDYEWGCVSTKDSSLFLYLTNNSYNQISLAGIQEKPKSIQLLGNSDLTLSYEWKDENLIIDIADISGMIPVLEIEFEEILSVNTKLSHLPDGSIVLPSHKASIHIANQGTDTLVDYSLLPDDVRVQFESKKRLYGDKRPDPSVMQLEPGGYIENWNSVDSFISWEFELKQVGIYEVWVQSVSSKYKEWEGGHKVKVVSATSDCKGVMKKELSISSPRSRYYPENSCCIGKIELDQIGINKIRLEALEIPKDRIEGLAVTAVILKPL